ncbi:LAFE_0G00628g1_1 [Lachancea fermentati]|uniref:LAFE_0G00628g1_1 n=1 Tax=Lachancea fermentati TaxID=4955 RepID=A0A1G4MGG0_LACFM|nr:LAFE_0G00628g1_1 [Lachancea fermentati]
MAEPDHLQIPSVTNHSATPKRGHRHKRSFAISEDFDFIKQPNGTPQDLTECFSASPTRNNNLSPRFFVSEEPTFSRGVPDAIIDLDDALTTKPRSFKSHRRTESAPADLNLPFRGSSPRRDFSIEEEESESECDEQRQQVLLSPLRTKSESPLVDGTTPYSPLANRACQMKNNSLKIHKQKERYYNYAKQIPATSPQGPNRSSSQQTSLSSMSSDQNSNTTTPPGVASTPNTPIFSTMKFSPRPCSPNKSFRFESQPYDLPSHTSPTTNGTLGDNDDNTLKAVDSEYQHNTLYRRSKSVTDCSKPEINIPKEILMGEPGDMTDLSSTSEPSQKHVTISKPVEHKKVDSFASKKSTETRSVSDSVVGTSKSIASREKRRSRFNILSTLFSKLKSQR